MKKGVFRFSSTKLAVAAVAVICTASGVLGGCVLGKPGLPSNTTPTTTPSVNQNTTGEVFPTYSNGHILSEDDLKRLDQIAKCINDKYYYADSVDSSNLTEELCRTLVDYLDEPYSTYYDQEAYKSLVESTKGTYSGMGALLQQDPETKVVTVVQAFSDSPANDVGIKDGDEIRGVDDWDISNMDLSEIVSHIKGETNTTVNIKIYRPSTKEELDFVVTRRTITPDVVTYEMEEDKIGYIYLSEFSESAMEQFENALDDLSQQGMEKIIIDLRNNPGGVVDTAVGIAGLFIDDQLVVYTEDKNGTKKTYTASPGTKFDGEMVVLVNANSASASEILTGALKDYKIATVIGTTSFGKGIVQGIYNMAENTAVKLTTSSYYTPNGNCIHGIGIEPDYYVELEKDSEEDNQLQAAIDYLEGRDVKVTKHEETKSDSTEN